MSIHPVHGTSEGDESNKRFYVDFYQQWSGLLGGCNWYDFTIIDIAGEFAPYTGRWELTFALLGLRCTMTYIYDHTFNDRMRKIIRDFRTRASKETQ